jgi:hypothetical protein
MDILKSFYGNLDQIDFTVNDSGFDVNTEFINIIEQLQVANDPHTIIVNREREALQFVKTAEDGLKPRMSSTDKNEHGEEIPVEWPDQRNFTQADYDYIKQRYQDSGNIYLKSEYGLFLYYSGQLKTNDEVEGLIGHLYAWSNQLWAISCKPEKNYNLVKYFHSVKHLFLLAKARKKASASINAFYSQWLNEFYDRHLTWDLNFYGLTRFILDSTDILINHYNDFKAAGLPAEPALNKNLDSLKQLEKSDPWESIYIADQSRKLAIKAGDERNNWRLMAAQQYERLAETGPNYNNVAVTFIEKALRIYREIKADAEYDRLAQKYQEQRNDTQLSEVVIPMPEEATDRVMDQINKLITEGSTEDILAVLVYTPMLADVETIRELSKKRAEQTSVADHMPVVIQDKFGNTVESYSTPEEKEEFGFLQHYSLHFQMASQTLLQVVLDAIRAGKLNASSIIAFFESTWINEKAVRRVNSDDRPISHLALLKPGIEILFSEMEKWLAGNGHIPDFVLATDSLTLKVEYLLREICMKLGIVTFKQRPDNKGQKIVMEKLFDDLIRDLRTSLGDDHYFFIKFIMSDKIGLNLRNQIAHGLMDNIEYGPESPFLILSILLKLAGYTFQPVV